MVIGFFSVNFCILAIKKNYMQMKKGLFGFLGEILPYLQGKSLEVVMLRYCIHKIYQYKTRF